MVAGRSTFPRKVTGFCQVSFGVFLILLCHLNAMAAEPGTAVSGIIDLRNWSFQGHGDVPLSGQWQFHWNRFILPSQIEFKANSPQNSLAEVPGSWDQYPEQTKPRGSDGYATYALNVLLPAKTDPLAIQIRNVLTAYTLYINGEKVQQTGRPGKSADGMIPEYRHVIVPVPKHRGEISLVFHVSNFHHRLGGLWASPVIGTAESLYTSYSHRLARNIFIIGAIFIMGLYHISLFLLRRTYTPPAWLGIFCILITLRVLVTNELYLHSLLPEIGWETFVKIEYLSFYLSVPVFIMFIRSLFPKELGKTAVRIFQGTAGLFSFVVICFPARIFSHTVIAYEAVTLTGVIFMLWVLIRALLNKRDGIGAILFGFIFLVLTIVNDMLHANSIIHTTYSFQGGFFVFIFSQAFVLSHRFSKAFGTIENQAEDLMGMNRVLFHEIQTRKGLETSLLQSHENFKNSRIALILGLAKLAEYRDTDTGTHLERIQEYVKILAEDLASLPQYQSYISPDYIEDIHQSSILHDIGKVGIRDAILLKPGKLTASEFDIMKTHTLIGGDAIAEMAAKVKSRSFLTLAKDIAYYHHERWDGSGYPSGLRGEDIPLSARIVSIADVYDALTSARPYKPAFSHEKAVKLIVEGKGNQFDPDLVDAFLRQAETIRALGFVLQDDSG